MAAKPQLLKGSHMTHALFGGALAHIEASDRPPANQSAPILADLGVRHMDIQFVDAPTFKEVYIRNNRTKGRKHIRCFPTCSEVHNATGFCGRPLNVNVELVFADEATASIMFPQLLFFGEVLPAFIADSTMLSSISSYSIETNVWGASNPEGCLYRGRMVSNEKETREDGQVYQKVQLIFNDALLRAWQYDWQNPAKCKSGHCFCVHVFYAAPAPTTTKPQSSPAPNPEQEEQRYVELYRGCSPTFRIVSARRFKTRTADDDPTVEVVTQRRRTEPSERPAARAPPVKPKRPMMSDAGVRPRDGYLKMEPPEHPQSAARSEHDYRVADRPPARTHEGYYVHPSLASGYLPVTVIGHHHPHAQGGIMPSHPREVADGVYARTIPGYSHVAVSYRPATYATHHPAAPAMYSIRGSVETPYLRTAVPMYATPADNEYRGNAPAVLETMSFPAYTHHPHAHPHSHGPTHPHPVYIGAPVTPSYVTSVSSAASIQRVDQQKARAAGTPSSESPHESNGNGTPKRPRMN